MSEYLLATLVVTVIFIAGLLIALLFQQRQLKRDHGLLEKQLQRHTNDLAGLCAAAVKVDQQLAGCEARLNDMIEFVNDYQTNNNTSPLAAVQPAQPETFQDYDDAIMQIRLGSGVDELVKQCGLTRDEAVLLLSLHGERK